MSSAQYNVAVVSMEFGLNNSGFSARPKTTKRSSKEMCRNSPATGNTYSAGDSRGQRHAVLYPTLSSRSSTCRVDSICSGSLSLCVSRNPFYYLNICSTVDRSNIWGRRIVTIARTPVQAFVVFVCWFTPSFRSSILIQYSLLTRRECTNVTIQNNGCRCWGHAGQSPVDLCM